MEEKMEHFYGSVSTHVSLKITNHLSKFSSCINTCYIQYRQQREGRENLEWEGVIVLLMSDSATIEMNWTETGAASKDASESSNRWNLYKLMPWCTAVNLQHFLFVHFTFTCALSVTHTVWLNTSGKKCRSEYLYLKRYTFSLHQLKFWKVIVVLELKIMFNVTVAALAAKQITLNFVKPSALHKGFLSLTSVTIGAFCGWVAYLAHFCVLV